MLRLKNMSRVTDRKQHQWLKKNMINDFSSHLLVKYAFCEDKDLTVVQPDRFAMCYSFLSLLMLDCAKLKIF